MKIHDDRQDIALCALWSMLGNLIYSYIFKEKKIISEFFSIEGVLVTTNLVIICILLNNIH